MLLFSTSDNPKDKNTSFEFDAADFITMPNDLLTLVLVLDPLIINGFKILSLQINYHEKNYAY